MSNRTLSETRGYFLDATEALAEVRRALMDMPLDEVPDLAKMYDRVQEIEKELEALWTPPLLEWVQQEDEWEAESEALADANRY